MKNRGLAIISGPEKRLAALIDSIEGMTDRLERLQGESLPVYPELRMTLARSLSELAAVASSIAANIVADEIEEL